MCKKSTICVESRPVWVVYTKPPKPKGLKRPKSLYIEQNKIAL